MKKTVLTGIKPTGLPHIGNYIGAIKPALARIDDESTCYYFVADYHAITSVQNAQTLNTYIYDVAATWLALGLDPEACVFYRQSRVPEITELNWILANFTAKGLMNRAHAYKTIVANNEEAQEKDVDKGVNMGLYTYPVLMAADILLFDSDIVPVGKDQVQHVEIARDIANKFNHIYKSHTLTLPHYELVEHGHVLAGLDGRKMSKSYHNTIPLFVTEKKLNKLIKQIKTDSKGVDEAKDPGTCNVYRLAGHFMSSDELDNFASDYRSGIGYGEAKNRLFESINSVLAEPREYYNELIHDHAKINALLKHGEEKAREKAQAKIAEIRTVVGLG